MAPYQKIRVSLEPRGQTYLIIEMVMTAANSVERTVRFAEFCGVSPGFYRPQTAMWTSTDGRTELTFKHWAVRPASAMLFSPAQLETQRLVVPEG